MAKNKPIKHYITPILYYTKGVGLECKIDVIEIPKAFCEDELFIDEEKYKLPDVT